MGACCFKTAIVSPTSWPEWISFRQDDNDDKIILNNLKIGFFPFFDFYF